MSTTHIIVAFLSILATANLAVMGYLAHQISEIRSEKVVCDVLCQERSKKCQRAFCSKLRELEDEDKALWERVNTHKHDDKGRVVIGP